jgi:4-aminobutyrate aminotransferase-like enzyme
MRGDELPEIKVAPPGPKSRAAAKRLRRAESGAIWGADQEPVVWARAMGSVVEDLDGNRYLDLTSGFGVASLGHAAPEVRRAVARQAGRLHQSLGDLSPDRARERLARRLSILGGRLSRVLLASTGSEAVELALKTAAVATGRRRVVAFRGAYHGSSFGALEVTDHPKAIPPLKAQLAGRAIHVPFPYPYRCPVRAEGCGRCDLECIDRAFETIDRECEGPDPPGAVIVEPIQGRAGVIVPPDSFLPELCRRARARGLLVIYDEILTGAGRTGPFWAWERSGVDAEPDLMAVGKGLGGGVAVAALLGRPEVMEAWSEHPGPMGEAPHASTFYGHPLAAAGALAAIERLAKPETREAIGRLGVRLRAGLDSIAGRHPAVGEVRCAGLLGAVELVKDRASRAPDPEALARLVLALRARGVLAVPAGIHGNVLQILPAFTITEEQLDHGRRAIDETL